jgi:hypothetical protein
MDWNEKSEFNSWEVKIFLFHKSQQNSSEAHPLSYSIGVSDKMARA